MSMEEWTGFELSDEVLDSAATWIAELDALEEATSLSPEQTLNRDKTIHRFNEWLAQHPYHHQAYAEMSLIWAKSSCIEEIAHHFESKNVVPFPTLGVNVQASFTQTSQDYLITSSPVQQESHSPAWAYLLALGLISVGLFIPALQTIF